MKRSILKIIGTGKSTLTNGIVWLVMAGVGFSSVELRADAVTDWNITAVMVAPISGLGGLPQERVITLMHIAIHDALNSIEPRYETYAGVNGQHIAASPDAAVAAAAYRVLVSLFPTQQAALDSAYSAALAGIPNDSLKVAGIALGNSTALQILTLRSSDGSANANIPYTVTPAPGVWQPTPPGFLPAALPGWGNVRPFALENKDQFSPDPPEFFDLTSDEYTRDYNEIKVIGSVGSSVRTSTQSDIAQFWYELSQFGWSRIARVVSAQKNLDLWENARLFALIHIAAADGYIAGWNTKYRYNFWRPVTAIRAGDTDGNPDTAADAGWESFLVTPPHPDFVSTHSVLGAAIAEVLADYFGSDFVSFTVTSGAPFPGITRSFGSFSEAARENADSRVFAGIHFRTSTREGIKLGEHIGKFTFQHYLRPLHQNGRD